MLHVSPLFSDGAVLCREKELRIFGEAEDGTLIQCELIDENGSMLAKGSGITREGKFLILLPPQSARTGCMLQLSSAADRFIARDIAIGDVFLAGGQSNMEMELQSADEGPELIKTHHHPQIRYLNIPKFGSFSREREEAWKLAHWQKILPGKGCDISAVAYFFALRAEARLNVPIGIIDCYLGGTSISCWMDEAWLRRTAEGQRYLSEYAERSAGISMEMFIEKDKQFHQELDSWSARVSDYRSNHPGCSSTEVTEAVGECPWNPPDGPGSPYRPAGLYDTMLAPLLPSSLTAFLFYQGETDAGRTEQYDVLMMSLIDRWRTAFQDETLPFLFVQLPMWIDRKAQDSKTWPLVRLAQSRVRDRMRNTGMVCLLDQGEFDNLHPTNKRVVGERLFDVARSVILHEQIAASPRILRKRVSASTLELIADLPLCCVEKEAPALLELAGADKIYVPAEAEVDQHILRLTAPSVTHPLYARYAWTDFAQVNLFSADGLPLEPFEC